MNIKTTKCKVVFHNKQFIEDYTINLGTAQMSVSIDTRVQRNQFERTFSEEFKKWRSVAIKWLILPNEKENKL